MATALLSPVAKQYFPTNAGTPAAGYKLYTYAANTTTPQATFTNRAGTVANQNPIILDARGEAIIYLTPGVVYDYHLYTDQDALEYTREDVIADAGDANAVAFLQAGTGAVPRNVQDKLREQVSALDYMSPSESADVLSGAGSLNVAASVQKAIDYVYGLGGGVVFFPPGVYRLTTKINISNGVQLVGSGATPYTDATEAPKPRGGGTWFHLDHTGVGFEGSASPNPVGSGAFLRNFGTFRTHPTPGPGWAPTAYEWDIATSGIDLTLEDLVLLNPYKGVRIYSSGFGRLQIHRLKMQAFNTGIQLDESFDTCRVEHVHQWPFWSDHAAVQAYTRASLVTYRVRRSDNAMFSHCFTIFHLKGMSIDGDGVGNTAFRLQVANCNFDPGAYGVVLEPGANLATAKFTGCSLISDGILATAAFLVSCNNSRTSFANCEFAESGANAIRVDGTGNTVLLSLAQVRNWNLLGGGFHGIDAAAGNTVTSEGRIYIEGGGAGLPFGGAGTITAPLGWGEFSGTTDASGDVTIPHNFRVAPRSIQLTFRAPDGDWNLRVESATTTNFKVRVRVANTGAIPGAGTPVTIHWRAEY